MSFFITAKCVNGHVQTIEYSGPNVGSREWAEVQAGLLDGTSSMYRASPIGTDSVIGKCGICKAQIHCTVERQRTSEPEPRLGPQSFDTELESERDEIARKITEPDPASVDRTQRVLTDGSPVTPDHLEILPNGQQKGYIVLSEEERRKGFVRPVRRSYVHVGKPPDGEKFEYPIRKAWPPGCAKRTTMSIALAETYARDPGFYGGTFCCNCAAHFPLNQFVWEGTTEQVGS